MANRPFCQSLRHFHMVLDASSHLYKRVSVHPSVGWSEGPCKNHQKPHVFIKYQLLRIACVGKCEFVCVFKVKFQCIVGKSLPKRMHVCTLETLLDASSHLYKSVSFRWFIHQSIQSIGNAFIKVAKNCAFSLKIIVGHD